LKLYRFLIFFYIYSPAFTGWADNRKIAHINDASLRVLPAWEGSSTGEQKEIDNYRDYHHGFAQVISHRDTPLN
jgi:hypothetical protein